MDTAEPDPRDRDPTSPARATVSIFVEVARGRAAPARSVELPEGSSVGAVVRTLGLSPEGAAVLIEGRPVALDRPVRDGERLVVVPTFSGG